MQQDISSREDIHFIITEFYQKLISDSEMLPFFEEIVRQNHLEKHINTITDFWQDILLQTDSYKNNVLQKHLDFDKKVRFKKEHFTKWLGYLTTIIDASFEGQVTQNMKDRANSIAMVMQVKFKLYD
ncbi:Group 3 truncated hemoglobin ctb [Polaribacter huanghezhanensis]|uniref:group III truncated hemoglobin n=1 Tax=Polaribacter huanghezhanensis TaxID=1354726 RepID=UPI0026492DC4|nr:group III truncated hemoglobin [Polaribacter huanghezhanensis]WKD86128.1 Group 3 truncated hemoglobin ctb [Polaribacter huanghezhanensis]